MIRFITFALAASLAASSFAPQSSGVTARLRGISAVDDRIAWASGSGGTIVRTADGGATWQHLTVPGADKLDFRDIDAIDANTAFALSIGSGESSRIYKTEDAGKTWILQFTNADPKAFFDAMSFWDRRRGLVFSDSVDGTFVIMRTATAGKVWIRVPADALPPALENEGAYAASGTNIAVYAGVHGWIGTSRSRVLHTADGGRSWTVAATPIATSQSAGIFSLAFRDAMHGVAVGGDYRKEAEAVDNCAVTSDGGTTWTMVKGLSGFRSVVSYVPGERTTLIAVGPQGADRSSDDGKTWTPLPGSSGLHTFSFAKRKAIGWGAGEQGRIMRLLY